MIDTLTRDHALLLIEECFHFGHKLTLEQFNLLTNCEERLTYPGVDTLIGEMGWQLRQVHCEVVA